MVLLGYVYRRHVKVWHISVRAKVLTHVRLISTVMSGTSRTGAWWDNSHWTTEYLLQIHIGFRDPL